MVPSPKNRLYGVAFLWTDLNRQHNVRILDKVRRSAAIYITGTLRATRTRALFAMLNLLPILLLAKQATKFTATRLNALSFWYIVPYGHSSILEVDTVTPVNIDYLLNIVSTEISTLIPSRDDWNPNTVVSPHGHIYRRL